MLSITRLRLLPNGKHFIFNLNYDGLTICGMIYRSETKAVLPPLNRKGGKAVRINPSRIPVFRKFIETEIDRNYERAAPKGVINDLETSIIHNHTEK